MSSGLDRDAVSILTASPHVARGADGRAAREPRGRTSSSRSAAMGDTTQLANVVVRGVSEQAWQVRNNVDAHRGHAARGRQERDLRRQAAGRAGSPTPASARRMHFAGRAVDRDLPLRGRRARRSSRRSGARTSRSCRRCGATASSRSPSAWRIRPRSTRPSACSRPTSGSRWTSTASRRSTPSSRSCWAASSRILAIMITGDHGGGRDLRRGQHDVRRRGVARRRRSRCC